MFTNCVRSVIPPEAGFACYGLNCSAADLLFWADFGTVWREEYLKTLKDVAAEARAVPEWTAYAAFCEVVRARIASRGVHHPECFISSLERAPFAERRRFVSWLSRRADRREGRHMLIPHPLHARVVEPTLLEWTVVEPDCSEPHLWLGGYEHVKRAFELEPDNQLARRKLIILTWGRVDFSAYELPTAYLGNINQDLAILREVEQMLGGSFERRGSSRPRRGPCRGQEIDRGASAVAVSLLGVVGETSRSNSLRIVSFFRPTRNQAVAQPPCATPQRLFMSQSLHRLDS